MGTKNVDRKAVTFAGMARIQQQDDVQLSGPVEEKFGATARSNTKIISRIHPVNLEDSVGEGRGEYTAVSIIDPTMRIERSPTLDRSDESESLFRIIVSFVLQASILNFDNPNQRHNRILDSVSLRYIYRQGERNKVLPEGDVASANIKVTQETVDRNTVGMGVQSQPFSPPSVTVQAQRDTKLNYERPMRSWRKGLSYEQYPPPKKDERIEPSLLAAIGLDGPIDPSYPPAFFHVESKHIRNCSCKVPHRHYCRYRESERHPYNRAARWTWQTEAMLHLWTPEVYQALNCPITIVRKVDANEVDRILDDRNHWDLSVLHRYVHFDFDIEVRVREIGHNLLDQLKPITKPAEVRAKDDFGKLMPADKSVFCLSPCLDRMHWPRFETRNLQKEAEDQARRFGYVPRLQSDEEYIRAENSRLHKENQEEEEEIQQCSSRNNVSSGKGSDDQPAGGVQPSDEVEAGDDAQRQITSHPTTRYYRLPAPTEKSSDWGGLREYEPESRRREVQSIAADPRYRRSGEQSPRPNFIEPPRRRWSDEWDSRPVHIRRVEHRRRRRPRKGSLADVLVNVFGL